jgi:MarR family multiple gene transcriptional regulator MgrA
MATIEELIHLPRFQSEKQKSVVSIYYINSLIVKHFEQILSTYNLTFQQFNVLRIIRGQHPNAAPVNLVKDRMLDRNSDASRLIGRLEKAGMLTNKVNKEDRRVADVMITAAGLEVLSQLDKMDAALMRVADGLTDEDATQLNQLLQKFLNGVEK